MRALILISLISLTACSKKPATEVIFIKPVFPPETLTPCPLSAREVATVNDLAALALENLRTAECANSKIETVAAVYAADDPAALPGALRDPKEDAPR